MKTRLLSDKSGNFGILLGILILPMVLAVGTAVDGTRYTLAENHLQDVADGLSLALAASSELDPAKLKATAAGFMTANQSNTTIDAMTVASLDSNIEQVDLVLKGTIETTFMQIAGYRTLDLEARSLAMRAPDNTTEVAMVLDNTYSMSGVVGGGKTRLDILKQAAADLVDQLLPDDREKKSVRIGLVPYADYVNVGTDKRGESWLDVEADTYTPAVPCEDEMTTVTTKKCGWYKPKTCTKNKDGIISSYSCDECMDPTYTSKQEMRCVGGSSARTETWHGCVGSRKLPADRLNDRNPTARYPGFVATSRKCFDPIQPLTDSKTPLLTAVKNMKYSTSGYEPLTFIPAGLIWGVNVLSPTAPYTEGRDYDTKNEKPRKILILMTDGDNTLKAKSDGTHTDNKGNPTAANAESLGICTYAKSQKIEIFTVAFMVNNQVALDLLQKCATDEAHYYDASDSAKLLNAFSGIARSIDQVRLAR